MTDVMHKTNPQIGDVDESFDVLLPDSEDVDGAAHPRRPMSGNETAYVDVLAEFVRTASDLSAPLREPIDASALDKVLSALARAGPGQGVASGRPPTSRASREEVGFQQVGDGLVAVRATICLRRCAGIR